MMLPVTSLVAAASAAALVAISIRVSLARMGAGRQIGDGGDERLLRVIRAQGNFVEYVPMALILLGLLELAGASAGLLWALGGLLAAGRLLHYAGMLAGSTPLRAGGMIGTYLMLLAAAASLVAGAVT